MLRTGKIFVAWAAILLIAADPASACRWRRCRPRPCYYYTCSPCVPVTTCVPVTCCQTSGYSSQPSQMQPTQSLPQPTYAPAPNTLPSAPEPMPEPQTPAQLQPAPQQPRLRPTQPEPAAEVPALEPSLPDETPEAAPAQPEEMPDEPAKPAAPSNDVEDLFKETDATDKKTDDAEPALSGATAEPPADSAEPAEKKGDDVEDLFKETSNRVAPSAPVANAELDHELEDLFTPPAAETKATADSEPQPMAKAVELADAMRPWSDNTGNYRVKARLVSIGDSSVRLLKDTGKYTTVPLSRLSADDLEFVRTHAEVSLAGKF